MVYSPEKTKSADESLKAQRQNLGLRRVSILLALIVFISFLAYQIDIAIPGAPSINNTYTPITQPTAQEIGSYDVLGKVISKNEAASLLKTDEGKQQLSADKIGRAHV